MAWSLVVPGTNVGSGSSMSTQSTSKVAPTLSGPRASDGKQLGIFICWFEDARERVCAGTLTPPRNGLTLEDAPRWHASSGPHPPKGSGRPGALGGVYARPLAHRARGGRG